MNIVSHSTSRRDISPNIEGSESSSSNSIDRGPVSPPYTLQQIPRILEENGLHYLGDDFTKESYYDPGLFQALIFGRLFAPDVDRHSPKYVRDVSYFLKKATELVRPLVQRCDRLVQDYHALIQSGIVGGGASLALSRFLSCFPCAGGVLIDEADLQGVVADMKNLCAWADALTDQLRELSRAPETCIVAEEQAVFLAIVHAAISDASNALRESIAEARSLQSGQPFTDPLKRLDTAGTFGLSVPGFVRSFLELGPENRSFLTMPLTPEALALNKELLTYEDVSPDRLHAVFVTAPRGVIGIVPILHAMFNRGYVLPVAVELPAKVDAKEDDPPPSIGVHFGVFEDRYSAILRHEALHGVTPCVLAGDALPSILDEFKLVFDELTHPWSKQSTAHTKSDLVVLFFLLHEHSRAVRDFAMISRNEPHTNQFSFAHLVKSFVAKPNFVVDMARLLNDLGYQIPPAVLADTPEDNPAAQPVAEALNRMWDGFSERWSSVGALEKYFDALDGHRLEVD